MYEVIDDEDRELLTMESILHDDSGLYHYCGGTKWLLNLVCITCKHRTIASCCIPFSVVADVISLVPLVLINNFKMCIRW